ncbi:D-isomer specific 2-hydroxyacid dehydrogenase [Dioszegia hungarica]|uniref:D-isomer specific 2-hydroxyacid dehydrogenase n=1 Tax=Dioszegia hungarica TaxID=4972 RepID=A0AA38HGG9_9TREE|nr:D-isomer specific 2-hydroxyacid dehydrogenase [Dioszegia hungarica]KAI9638424.1 D-isomer specific 2-hydroxyacid dehydrogenase [Dioszegia hungarica]
MTAHTYTTLVLGFEVSPDVKSKLDKTFHTVHYHPDGSIPDKAWRESDVCFAMPNGLPDTLKLEQVPNLHLVQILSAGANKVLEGEFFKNEKAWKQISVSTASGIHVYSIPQYIIGQAISLYMNLHQQHWLLRSRNKWATKPDVELKTAPGTPTNFISLRGKTAGMLGYGHIAREAARLFQAHGVNVIAANTRGEKSKDTGFIVPGTGDKNGSIPSAYYSTSDEKSFDEFLSKTDILVASLPSTPQTQYLLKSKHFKALRENAIFINVGRGDLVSSDVLLEALDASPPHILAVGIDVTDPEPLPDGHPLFTHPRALITPHTSGDFAGYVDAATELLVANVEQLRKGGVAFNKVDPARGY